MKIERKPTAKMTIEEFAENHDLTMEVVERNETDRKYTGHKFYASFKDAGVKEGQCISYGAGNGNTEEKAIEDYGKIISGEVLILSANTPNREEIRVPTIVIK